MFVYLSVMSDFQYHQHAVQHANQGPSHNPPQPRLLLLVGIEARPAPCHAPHLLPPGRLFI
jgi:hypothetical protein